QLLERSEVTAPACASARRPADRIPQARHATPGGPARSEGRGLVPGVVRPRRAQPDRERRARRAVVVARGAGRGAGFALHGCARRSLLPLDPDPDVVLRSVLRLGALASREAARGDRTLRLADGRVVAARADDPHALSPDRQPAIPGTAQ